MTFALVLACGLTACESADSETAASSSSVSSSVPSDAGLQAVLSAESGADAASEAPYEAELRALVEQLYTVQAQAESDLNRVISDARAEYKALPAEKQTKARKLSICMSKAGELKKLESACDKEVEGIVNRMRTILTENGQSTALADEAMDTYKAEKSAMYSSLMEQLYG